MASKCSLKARGQPNRFRRAFIRGGSRNITAENAGIEALMLDAATEASRNFPRERLRSELARMEP
jgi:hypothetical protein